MVHTERNDRPIFYLSNFCIFIHFIFFIYFMQALPQQISLLTANFKYVRLLTRTSLFQFLYVCETYLWVKSFCLFVLCFLSLSRRSRSSWLHEIPRKSSHPWDIIIHFILWTSIWMFLSPPVSSSQFLRFSQLLYSILGGWSACQQRYVTATAVPL